MSLSRKSLPATAPEFLRIWQVEQRYGIPKSSIYRMIQSGTFPPPLILSTKIRCWRKADLDVWQQNLPRKAISCEQLNLSLD